MRTSPSRSSLLNGALVLLLAVLAVAAVASPAAAQPPDHTDVSLVARGTVGVADSRTWLGRADGGTLEVGFAARGEVVALEEPHDLHATVVFESGLAPAPRGEGVVKASDRLALDATYVHDVLAWFGPYLRLGARTSLLRATDHRDAPTTWRIRRGPESVETIVADRLALTDPLLPATLQQSIGLAIRPVRTTPVEVAMRFGIGGRETFAAGQRALDDDPATPTVEVLEARDAALAGGVSGLSIAGALEDQRLVYRLQVETTWAVIHPDLRRDGDRGMLDLATVDAGAVVAVALLPQVWVEYEFEAVREPLVIDAFQFRNVLRLTVGAGMLRSSAASR